MAWRNGTETVWSIPSGEVGPCSGVPGNFTLEWLTKSCSIYFPTGFSLKLFCEWYTTVRCLPFSPSHGFDGSGGWGKKPHKHLCKQKCPLTAFSYWTRITILPIILKTKQHLSKLIIAKGAWSQFSPPKKNSNNWLHSKKFLVQAIGLKNSSWELKVPVYLPLQGKLFKECKLQ